MFLNNGLSGLEEFISGVQGKVVLFTGIGNVLRKDDGVGVYISRNILETCSIKTLTVEVALENYIGKINTLQPDILVLIDCTWLQQSPGYYAVISPDLTPDHTFNTHSISLKRLKEFFPMTTKLLAIQPQEISFGESLTPDVKRAADEIIAAINRWS